MNAIFISPHLDDVAFSCGATLVRLVRAGSRVRLLTAFTATVPNPSGFALNCQLDKGLSPAVDYMALRRQEDCDFARIADVADVLHLPHPEAPHRGYASPPELFAGIREDDQIWEPLADDLRRLADGFDVVFAPQGLGNHADHLQTIRAVLAADLAPRTVWYRDLPYAIRHPHAPPSSLLPSPTLSPFHLEIQDTLPVKLAGCAAYRTQIGFQFGGDGKMRRTLAVFHQSEAAHCDTCHLAETFLAPADARRRVGLACNRSVS